jgi:hypothetical protein
MDTDSAEIGVNGETVSVGEKYEIIADPPTLISAGSLSVGDVIEIKEIKREGVPQGIEVTIGNSKFLNGTRNVSPTTLGEALGTVDYKQNPEPCLKQV